MPEVDQGALPPSADLIAELSTKVSDEVIASIGLSPTGVGGRLLACAVRPVARRFATRFAGFDRDVLAYGTAEAARRMLTTFVEGWQQSGAEAMPREGPLLVASNHPGATDSIVLMACVPRPDLKIVISDVPFTRALPAGRAHLIYASDNEEGRVRAMRDMIRHLRDGGAILIFPGGYLDPDPALLPGAGERLAGWSRSILLALRRAPETRLVGAIVGGVLAPRFLSHLLTRLAPEGWERFKVAEELQIVHQMLSRRRYGLNPRATFGPPVTLSELRARTPPGGAMEAIVDYARQVLAAHVNAARAQDWAERGNRAGWGAVRKG